MIRPYIAYDVMSDVLYANLAGSGNSDRALAYSREAPTDSYLILSYDFKGNVGGLILLCAKQMPRDYWLKHPDKEKVPALLHNAVSEWLCNMENKT